MPLESFVERHARRGLAAAAEALFPANDNGAPDHRETELVPRTLEYWGLLPRRQRRLLVLLFACVELASPLLLPGWRRFSGRPIEAREAAVRRWRRSSLFPLRILGDALKASLTVLYMSHPAALAHVGARRGGLAAPAEGGCP
jgi:hypothetical protein